MEPVDAELAADRTADRYRLERIHSQGGLGRVWLARDPRIDRDVALKELLPEQALDVGARARFLREARITGQLEHPNIVPVYEIGERLDRDGRPYYTMRFVSGQTLSDAIADHFAQSDSRRLRDRRTLRRLLGALVNLCNAVAFAHSRGVLHRDLKPANVVLGRYGELILLDWGLAKLVDEASDGPQFLPVEPKDGLATGAGAVIGTLAYMAPEQARGDVVDRRTDVYGLGAILFEILTGRPPHAGAQTTEILKRIRERPTPRARDIDRRVPRALEAVCARAMAGDPASRYGEVRELAEDLERYLADEPVSAWREPLPDRIGRVVRRHQSAVLAAAVAMLVVLLVVSVAAGWMGHMAGRERSLRERGMHAAALLAARSVAIQVDLRWRILESAASDALVRESVLALNTAAPPNEEALRRDLQRWLTHQFEEHSEVTKAVSWFVNRRDGLQMARVPFSDRSVGANFAFRDYFHGRGVDLPADDNVVTEPIQDVHRSLVFRSSVTGNLMVAFSAPIRAPTGTAEADTGEVIGVMAMTVELGRFGVLQLGLGDDQIAVLVDTRPDQDRRRGLVLHHPKLAAMRLRQRQDATGELPRFYQPEDRVAQFMELRRDRIEDDRTRDRLPWEEQVLLEQAPLRGSFDASYVDPAGAPFDGRWLAAFEPVMVVGRPDSRRDTGWVVVVQERRID